MDAKAEARAAAALRRAGAHGAGQGGAMTEHLLGYLAPFRGLVIAGYLPMRTEADPVPAMLALSDDSPICVPVIVGRGLPLVFREWHAGTELAPASLGTSVPTEGEMLTPEVLIVPMLAYDRSLHRLGYGGGYYDRTLAALRLSGRCLAVGLAYADQLDPDLPVGPFDQRLDAIVTEGGVLTSG